TAACFEPRRYDSATYTTKTSTNRPMTARSVRALMTGRPVASRHLPSGVSPVGSCHVAFFLFYVAECLEIGDREFEDGLTLELVFLEREGQVDAGAMLGE